MIGAASPRRLRIRRSPPQGRYVPTRKTAGKGTGATCFNLRKDYWFMWKIERAVEGDAVVFRVSGRMQGELLAELEKAFAAETKTPAVAVDMQNVRLADQETVRFLAMYEAQGVRLLNCPGYVREWITRMRGNPEAG